MRVVAYTWRIAVNIFYVIVVIVVLMDIKNPSEKAIVSVLGLIYVLIRSQAILQAISDSTVMAAIGERLDQIYYHIDHSFEMPDAKAAKAAIETAHIKLYIDGVFLSFISIACLWAFFTAY